MAPFAPDGRRGRALFSVQKMLRIHFMQQWFTLSDPARRTYPERTDTLGLDFHFAAEVNSAVAGMAALALLCISFSKLMGDF